MTYKYNREFIFELFFFRKLVHNTRVFGRMIYLSIYLVVCAESYIVQIISFDELRMANNA